MEKLANIDLNLLVVFDLLYQEQNTQRVALRLGITQPAVSHALKRLRHLLEDELFERTSQGLQPTPRASQLHPGIADALAKMHDTLKLCDDFNRKNLRGKFSRDCSLIPRSCTYLQNTVIWLYFKKVSH